MRCVPARAGVNALLAVVGQVVDEAADRGVGEQTRSRNASVDDLRDGRLLHRDTKDLQIEKWPQDVFSPCRKTMDRSQADRLVSVWLE